MKEDVIAKKRTALSNLEPTQAPTTMGGLRNNKREPRRLQKRLEHGGRTQQNCGRIQLTSMNHLP
jgi:hypothetical protein